ncbi:MAG: helix-turn-helix transcriptional regulator [Spirochaetaceae bacterium]|nr:helix-turn-helix transcriptional regulator [Spirochaetaceae bacterium]MCF7947696.1 helix-turn-helix transcriptional regulator [Spirochaetia bacterium]MCF7950523.1 helix-turn-helix transcriptional regulator [Spirochaetaceae bacterium]
MTKVQELLVVNLKRARYNKGLSQMKLAERANLSLGFIGDIESGKKFPSANSIQKIVDSLKIQPFELFIDIHDSHLNCPLSKLRCVQTELVGKIDEEISQTLNKHFYAADISKASVNSTKGRGL